MFELMILGDQGPRDGERLLPLPARDPDGGMTERELQIAIAIITDLVPMPAAGVVRARYQPTVGPEVLHGREAMDVVDLEQPWMMFYASFTVEEAALANEPA